ncbi:MULTISPECIES: DNA-directed RNA polymerase subunit beta [unclassified Salinibacterium]|uniref:DNA-directed RNA polymerase subunit beta n=1 Tax=unclassified Salinibacterium TaxID=2632331 RepID=UPI0014233674|nr:MULTISPECIES: DNA-directed RNA polymerase subunit beta [unclassified Salinibacterium]
MTEDFHRPTRFPTERFEAYQGGDDPAEIMRVAHDSARALIDRAKHESDDAVIERLIAYTDTNGVDALAELWARSSPTTLPGALWRIYLVRALIRQDAAGVSQLFQRGTEVLRTIDAAVAGAAIPTGPAEIVALADEILRGAFRGDFAIALDRAAAFCRVTGAGATSVADDQEGHNPERSSELTRRALRLSTTAQELTACARLWRSDSLE